MFKRFELMSKKGLQPRAKTMMPYVAITAAFVLLCFRVPYGLDFTDEPYFLALCDWMLDGSRPFVDIWAIHQTSAIAYLPVYAALKFVMGGSEGIILASRFTCVLSFYVVSIVVARCLVKGGSSSLISTIVSIAFVCMFPLCIRDFNYNTIAILLIAIISLLLVSREWSPLKALLLGYVSLLLVQVYPYMIGAAAFALIAYCLLTARQRRLRFLTAGLLLGLLQFVATCALCGTSPLDVIRGIPNLLNSTHGVVSVGSGAPPGLVETVAQYLGWPGAALVVLLVALMFCFGRNRTATFAGTFVVSKGFVASMLLLSIFVVWFLTCATELKSHPIRVYLAGFVVFGACVVELFLFYLYRRDLARRDWLLVIFAALTFASVQMGSDQSVQISGYFLYPILFVLAVKWGELGSKDACLRRPGRHSRHLSKPFSFFTELRCLQAVQLIVAATIACVLLLSQVIGCYRDSVDVGSSAEPLATGPARGILTTADNSALYGSVENKIASLELGPDNTISVEVYCPIAFLMVDSVPLGFSPGRVSISSERLSKWYEVHGFPEPDVICVFSTEAFPYQRFSSDDRGGFLGSLIESRNYSFEVSDVALICIRDKS